MLGNLVPTVLFLIIIAVFENNPELGYGVGVTICAAIGFVMCFLSYYYTEERCGDVALSNMGGTQSSETILGIKALCVLLPAVESLGSWAAFRFIWKIDKTEKFCTN